MKRLRLAACVVLAIACGSKRDAAQVEKPAAVVAAPVPAAPAVPAAAAILESDVRALVDRWTAAQNGGDFAAYEAMYAERFQGIKRVATRTYRFDRKGWMRDRKRMFAAPMKVVVADVALTIGVRSALVRFEQDWSSRSFHDRGPKQLVLVAERGGLRIANEQMIASAVETAAGEGWSLLDFMQVVHARRDYVVLALGNEADAWAIGRPELDGAEGGPEVARKAADVERLPQAVRDVLGKTVVAYGATGEVCRAEVGKPFVWRRVIRQFIPEDDAEHAPESPEQAAQGIWDEAAELTLLVAELSKPDKNCGAALWARAAERPAPVVFAQEDAAPELVQRVEKAARALPHYREMDREYRRYLEETAYGAAPARWENFEDGRPDVSAWRSGERRLVSYDVSVGSCSEFGGGLWALFELRGDALVLVAQRGSGGVPDDFGFIGVIDVDLDGLPDALGGNWDNVQGEADAVTRGVREGLRLLRDVAPPFHGCGC